MRITKALIAKLTTNLKGTLETLSKDDVAYIVKKSNEAFHGKGEAFIPDAIFDQLKAHLESLNSAEPALAEVGAFPVAGKKVKLPYYMGSMDKIKSDDRALAQFMTKYPGPYLVSDKLDGISAMLQVKKTSAKNTTVTLYTRGDGTTGQDITHLLTYINGIPSKADLIAHAAQATGGELTVRGELIITRADFETVKSKGANARNMVAGIVNAKKPNTEIAKLIKFMAYSLIKPDNTPPSEAAAFLNAHGFNHAYTETHPSLSFDQLSDILVRRRRESPFEVDGVVVTQDRYYPLETGKNPSYAFAFKNIITQETAEVTVTNVEWNASKDGYLIPVVEFDGVKLAGVIVKRASGFNGEFIHTNSIGPGARITVTRSGDVIPYILQIIEKAPKPQMPTEPYVWTDTGKDIYLENASQNTEVRQRQIENFFTKLNVPGMRAGTVAKLFNAGLDTLPKILKATPATIASIEGFQLKSAEKIVEAIRERLITLECVDLMDASNAFGRGFGSKRLAAILAALPDISTSDTFIPTTTALLAIEGVSDKTADAFIKGLKAYREFKKELGIKCSEPAPKKQKVKSDNNRFNNQVVVFTGFRDAALKAIIEEEGGQVSDNFSSKTTILVAKDIAKATGKVEKAREKGVTVMSLDEFKVQFNV